MSAPGDPAAAEGAQAVSVAAVPQAAASVRRLRSWGGLVGFGLVLVVSWRHGTPPAGATLRALAGGVVGAMAAWAGGVTIWRHLLRARMTAAAQARREQRRRQRSAAGGETA